MDVYVNINYLFAQRGIFINIITMQIQLNIYIV